MELLARRIAMDSSPAAGMLHPAFLVSVFYFLYLWVSLRESLILWYFTLSAIDPQWTHCQINKISIKHRTLHKVHTFLATFISWPTVCGEGRSQAGSSGLHRSLLQQWAGQAGLLLSRLFDSPLALWVPGNLCETPIVPAGAPPRIFPLKWFLSYPLTSFFISFLFFSLFLIQDLIF